jgi:hypothetical protein
MLNKIMIGGFITAVVATGTGLGFTFMMQPMEKQVVVLNEVDGSTLYYPVNLLAQTPMSTNEDETTSMYFWNHNWVILETPMEVLEQGTAVIIDAGEGEGEGEGEPIPDMLVLSPNGGEVVNVGEVLLIEWETTNVECGNVTVEINKESTGSTSYISRSGSLSGMIEWRVPYYYDYYVGDDFTIGVSLNKDTSVSDKSDTPFTIQLGL